ncbi:uncharacterized protein LOC112502491 [Cynara cardunculus var. scolymus]|uniref:uncharacterized protein LOC112502491 n=1 Tax=Cynara cardunculus var. scolymus TaxID=59895 RepID=UPI000D62C806|nr:uncharacterized protein LOC112502491 [Cynara cardunculus var. scolymus]
MEQTSKTQQQKRVRVSWKDPNVVKTFLESCITEVGLNGNEGASLKALSWKKVADTLKSTHNFVVDRKQMWNHFDYLKGKYGAWLKLKNKTGNVYDPSTNTFNLTLEEWELEIETNRYVESLRTTSLPYPDLCARLFEGGMSTCVGGYGPSSKDPLPTTEPFVVIEEEINVSSDQAPVSSTPCSSHAPVEKQKHKKTTKDNSELDEKLIKFLDTMASKYGNYALVSYESCPQKLNELGWAKDDPLYHIAFSLLMGNRNRETWMTIASEIAKEWGAIGTLDGTLIHAIVPASHQTAYRGRGGGRCYQNVLEICDFNMIFTFVWTGWEGIVHDSRILREVAFNPRSGFPFPPQDKYYLCDVAYTNARGFLAPYRNTRYWLADFRRRRALTKEERFNHAHAQLRNVIERTYGVLKARFPILKQMAPFPFTTQRNVKYHLS